jgi:hypothetical protein
MATNDAIVGAILSAMDLMIRAVPVRIEEGSEQAREIVEYSLHNMPEQTFEMFLSDVLSFLPYGFSLFEIVARPPSAHPEGWVTLKKLAPRAQWTIDRFETNPNGDLLGVWQTATTRSSYIPYTKLLHFRTASRQNDPAGLSVLRSAYESWFYARRIREIEAVAIERELNGLPLVRIPSEYLAEDASDAQRAFVTKISAIARDVKRNEMGYIVIPSDVYEDADGKLTDTRLVDFELIASQGKRDIDTHQVVLRYQMDMARSALADFVMLGVNDRGSFALSKSKADLFLQALTGYVSAIASILNRNLVPKLMDWNGIARTDAPKIVFGRVAPVDLALMGCGELVMRTQVHIGNASYLLHVSTHTPALRARAKRARTGAEADARRADTSVCRRRCRASRRASQASEAGTSWYRPRSGRARRFGLREREHPRRGKGRSRRRGPPRAGRGPPSCARSNTTRSVRPSACRRRRCLPGGRAPRRRRIGFRVDRPVERRARQHQPTTGCEHGEHHNKDSRRLCGERLSVARSRSACIEE